ncbi:MAG: CRISPR-associated helicase Cas3' [Bacillota bacterium]|nr:CRISPR-associated helicase Cas3' [Bacillota bacterium]
MSAFMPDRYREFFRSVVGVSPYDYQVTLAEELTAGHNVVLRAPTGAGKTWAAMVPLFYEGWGQRPARLVYALPLRTLAQGIYVEASRLAQRLAQPVAVTLQTGEQPDDPFFNRGTIVVTTYDQVLSGLLCGPYGLSDRLSNINAAAIAGALVVFDEFHLMEPQKAFLTAVATMHMFAGLCQSVWMTATATESLVRALSEALEVRQVPRGTAQFDALLRELPSVDSVSRGLTVEQSCLSAESVLRVHERRSIVVCNQVGRAQELFRLLRQQYDPREIVLLHSRFLKADRSCKEAELRKRFGKGAVGGGILVATQVIEAGLDISCEHLHTEMCPINSLVQRAGRCARFPDETGLVHVYPLPPDGNAHRPYEALEIRVAQDTIGRGATRLTPELCARWVEKAHGESDGLALRDGWRSRYEECLRRIEDNSLGGQHVRVADLIREVDNIRVVIAPEPPGSPGELEGVAVPRTTLYGLIGRHHTAFRGWVYKGDDEQPWESVTAEQDVRQAYVVCLSPAVAAYDRELGLRLGVPGEMTSPSRSVPDRPGWKTIKGETWERHAREVASQALARLEREGPDGGLVGGGLVKRYGLDWAAAKAAVGAASLLHDLGKVQTTWQAWARAAMETTRPGYVHARAIAHTDFNPESRDDRRRERALGLRRPPHAAAGAYYAGLFLPRLLQALPTGVRAQVGAACVVAILAHHGGWLPGDLGMQVAPLWDGWPQELASVVGWVPDGQRVVRLAKHADKKGLLERVVREVVGPDRIACWWPLVAYLIRTLRLSDQQATAEVGSDD